MKIVMLFDQIQSGLGTKDDTMVPLTGKKEAVGPAVMMQPFLKEIGGHVMACLCCGNGTYLADPDEVSRKLCAMVMAFATRQMFFKASFKPAPPFFGVFTIMILSL